VYTRALQQLGQQAFPEALPPYPSWWRTARSQRSAAVAGNVAGPASGPAAAAGAPALEPGKALAGGGS